MDERILSIDVSDACAGSGVQADIKTIQALGGYATTAITALSFPSSHSMFSVYPLHANTVTEQIRVVLKSHRVDAIKIGLMVNEDIINAVADIIDTMQEHDIPVIVDPVMSSHVGDITMDKSAKDALKRRLLIRADVLTPNAFEAAELTGMKIEDFDDMKHAAEMLLTLGCRHVFLKGGDLDGGHVYDLYADEQDTELYEFERISAECSYGIGSALSSALTLFIARGHPVKDAVRKAREYVTGAIAASKLKQRGGFLSLNHGTL